MSGQHRSVWTEMVQHAGELDQSVECLADAHAVIAETLDRSVRNIERLVEGLPRLGDVFKPGDGLAVRKAPAAHDAALLESIEFSVGPFPLAFRSLNLAVGYSKLL